MLSKDKKGEQRMKRNKVEFFEDAKIRAIIYLLGIGGVYQYASDLPKEKIFKIIPRHSELS